MLNWCRTPSNKRYDIAIRTGVTEQELAAAETGTVRRDGRGQDPYLIHTVDGIEYRTKISTLRGDYRKDDGTTATACACGRRRDFKPRPDDIFQERLYCVQWMRPKKKGKGDEYEFRAVTPEDLERERIVEEFIAEHLADWQAKGWVPDMRIEPGDKTDEPDSRRVAGPTGTTCSTRGSCWWLGLVNRFSDARLKFGLTQVLNCNSPTESMGHRDGGVAAASSKRFDNQALNTCSTTAAEVCSTAASLSDTDVQDASRLHDVHQVQSSQCQPIRLASNNATFTSPIRPTATR